jgi:N utilization substance protein B
MARRRHLSRIAVMQVLFEKEKHPSCDPDTSLIRNTEELGDLDEGFAKELLAGVTAHHDDICAAIQSHAPDWPLDRMDPISRSILLIGGEELLYRKDAPAAVVMNEAIDVDKEYGTPESGKFVNGVLNAVAQAIGSKK